MWKNVRKTNKSIFHIFGGKLSKIGYSIPKTEPWNRITKTHILTYDSCMVTKFFTIVVLGWCVLLLDYVNIITPSDTGGKVQFIGVFTLFLSLFWMKWGWNWMFWGLSPLDNASNFLIKTCWGGREARLWCNKKQFSLVVKLVRDSWDPL